MNLRKDHVLDELAGLGNVAQFVSFAPVELRPKQTFSRVWQYPPNHHFDSHSEAIHSLLQKSPDRSINLRSYTPDNPRSRQFLYGLSDPEAAIAHLRRLTSEGLYVIANETVDISDGGVSGVIEGGVIEFAPDDTPRCVEKPGTASFDFQEGLSVLKSVYGFEPEIISKHSGYRVEFSIHPKARGFKRTHTLLWEREEVSTSYQRPTISWPNRFSRLVGDKVFGLLVADLVGVLVPRSIVISRRLKPFIFGQPTGSAESWLRTCPHEQDPGRFTTVNAWIDPFKLLSTEDPEHNAIASVISQAAVPAAYSGAAIVQQNGALHVEGTIGAGDSFMLGRSAPQNLPGQIIRDLHTIYDKLQDRLGPVRFEWVHDGSRVWIVQLHKGATSTVSTVVVPGEALSWVSFRTQAGLEALRHLLSSLAPGIGLELDGDIGLTSHLADLARKSGRPTRVVRQRELAPQQLKLKIDL